MGRYALGIDFGTLSARALVLNLDTGEEMGCCEHIYKHGVMDESLPCGRKLGKNWALQHPSDYIDVLRVAVPEAVARSGIDPADVMGVATDFTACTIIPVKADGTPLCMLEPYKNEPHAYVKLWKHHAAQDEANRLNEIAVMRKEDWLGNYGGRISSEWAVPKIWQVYNEAPEIYAGADFFIEAADWIVWQLCGTQVRGSCTAGYKAMWNKRRGYPSKDFFAALDAGLENLVDDKLSRDIVSIGSKAGILCAKAAHLTGLREGIAVAVGNVDAHVCVPAVGISGIGKMLAIMGTSTCHMLLSDREIQVPGICGVVEDGILPGFYGYEAGQSCVGDHFAWFAANCVPPSYHDEAARIGLDIHELLSRKAAKLAPGESGLLALDWWNGNRSVLMDADLSGVMLGMTLRTRPEEMYRALIEATAFGTRMIIETFRSYGAVVDEFYASGGISVKNPFAMQIYADIINMKIRIAASEQGPALGSAIFAAVAAGAFKDIFEAAGKLGNVSDEVYTPNPFSVEVYDKLYAEYVLLHDFFGRGGSETLKRLREISGE